MEHFYNFKTPEAIKHLIAKIYSLHHMYDKKVVFTNGCFDLLHVGHVRYLQEAKKQGDFLIVGLNSDSSVKEIKGESRPVQKENDRAEILLGLNAVDSVCIFSEDTPLKLIQSLMPDVLVKGGDWSVEDIIGHKEVLAAGGEVKSLSFIEGHSTTDLINSSQGLS